MCDTSDARYVARNLSNDMHHIVIRHLRKRDMPPYEADWIKDCGNLLAAAEYMGLMTRAVEVDPPAGVKVKGRLLRCKLTPLGVKVAQLRLAMSQGATARDE